MIMGSAHARHEVHGGHQVGHAAAVTILYPRDGSRIRAGTPMRLWALAVGPDDLRVDDEALAWQLDGRPVGHGRELWMAAPAPGVHEAVVLLLGEGSLSEARVRFITVPAGGLPR